MSGQNEPTSPISLKQKLKCSLRLPWHRHHNHHHHSVSASTTPLSTPSPSPKDNNNNNNHDGPRLTRTSSTCFKSPELKDKYRNLINRIGSGHRRSQSHGHSRRNSADFRYDPSSYALNFDDSQFDEFPFKNFTARLPPSPTATTHNSRGIIA